MERLQRVAFPELGDEQVVVGVARPPRPEVGVDLPRARAVQVVVRDAGIRIARVSELEPRCGVLDSIEFILGLEALDCQRHVDVEAMRPKLADDLPDRVVGERRDAYARVRTLQRAVHAVLEVQGHREADPVHLHAPQVFDVAQRDQPPGSVHLPQRDGIGGVPPVAGDVDGA